MYKILDFSTFSWAHILFTEVPTPETSKFSQNLQNSQLQNPYFNFFCKFAKNAKRHKKLKTKARYEISTIKLV